MSHQQLSECIICFEETVLVSLHDDHNICAECIKKIKQTQYVRNSNYYKCPICREEIAYSDEDKKDLEEYLENNPNNFVLIGSIQLRMFSRFTISQLDFLQERNYLPLRLKRHNRGPNELRENLNRLTRIIEQEYQAH